MKYIRTLLVTVLIGCPVVASAQKYYGGLIDKSVAVVGNEMIMLSQIEQEVQMLRAQGMASDRNVRCEILEQMLESKLFLMQARVDSLSVNQDMVEGDLSNRVDQIRTQLGGDEEVEKYFGKPLYRLREEWRKTLEDQNLTMLMQQEIVKKIPDLTPYDVEKYIEKTDPQDLPVVPIKYRLSQICIYPDREAADNAVKERLLALRERIINGEKFSTLARIYSQDPGSARRGGELGMTPKANYWPAFSDAAMSLKEGQVSQIVETPDGYHIIQMIEKDGDMFNARHILIKPEYSDEERDRAFARLDSIRNEILSGNVTFEMAAKANSEDLKTRTNGGQMADEYTGSIYFDKDHLKPADYTAISSLNEGGISEPFQSLDNEGRGQVVYKIIRIDRIIPSHVADYSLDYDLLLNVATNIEAEKAVEDFINEKINSTYIIIDQAFKDCDFKYEGWFKNSL